jgi:hypothetical protein
MLHWDEYEHLQEFLLSPDSISVLKDICQVLEVPHSAQQLLSFEKTPTLSMVLPVYSLLIDGWKHMQEVIPELSPYVTTGLVKLQKYINMAHKSRIYVLATGTCFLYIKLSRYTDLCSK